MRHLILLSLFACNTDVKVGVVSVDADSDGYDQTVDCDDGRNDVNPTAPERCDGRDNDCDGITDEDASDGTTWYADDDADGHGDPDSAEVSCDTPAGATTDGSDCDDAAADVHPGAVEVCNGVDDDCDGEADNDAEDAVTSWPDGDGDGYGADDAPVTACEVPDGYSLVNTDCDDGDAAIHPDAAETDCTDPTDYNCDGSVASADADGDGWIACEECDDGDAARNPDAAEICDGSTDEDCDGLVDDDDASVSDPTTWHRDADGDGRGDADVRTSACAVPAGYVGDDQDCDDSDAERSPDLPEVCDDADKDEDCDGLSDDDDPSATGKSTWYTDADGDGYAGTATLACDGTSSTSSDCDDSDAEISPGAEEICDDADEDEDCDGSSDGADASEMSTWYLDGDGDGVGGDTSTEACEAPTSYVGTGGDCDDADPTATTSCLDLDWDLTSASAILRGRIKDGRLGGAIMSNDVDGDGVPDLWVSAAEDGTRGSTAGAAFLVKSPFSGTSVISSAADAIFEGKAANERVGTALCSAGDVDGDGMDDLYVGASLGAYVALVISPYSSRSYLTSIADATFQYDDYSDAFGCRCATGAFDGDGTVDLVVGAFAGDLGASNAGEAYLFLDATSGTTASSDADAIFVGEDVGDYAGLYVDAADMNGDGYDDVIVAGPLNDAGGSEAGAAYVVEGPSTGTVDLSDADATVIGGVESTAASPVGSVGDLDGDGYTDLGVATPNIYITTDALPGVVNLMHGPVSGTSSVSSADATLTGEVESDGAGWFDIVGDVNGDGAEEIAVGASWYERGSGRAYLMFGPFSGALDLADSEVIFTPETSGGYMGGNVEAVGDLDSDGVPDLALAATYESTAASKAGSVYVLSLGSLF